MGKLRSSKFTGPAGTARVAVKTNAGDTRLEGISTPTTCFTRATGSVRRRRWDGVGTSDPCNVLVVVRSPWGSFDIIPASRGTAARVMPWIGAPRDPAQRSWARKQLLRLVLGSACSERWSGKACENPSHPERVYDKKLPWFHKLNAKKTSCIDTPVSCPRTRSSNAGYSHRQFDPLDSRDGLALIIIKIQSPTWCSKI